MRRLMQAGLQLRENNRLVAIERDAVLVADSWSGAEERLAADTVVTAWYGVADDGLAGALIDAGHDVRVVGDALAPRRAIDAIWDGFRVGVEL
jgi:2,4-dienoyl-CoA reductase (NADPH2)